jgi:predicted glycosyltransferase
MLREACALSIPSYSFFSGKIGRVDEFYVDNRKMHLLRDPKSISKIEFTKCSGKKISRNPDAYYFIRDFILNYMDMNE